MAKVPNGRFFCCNISEDISSLSKDYVQSASTGRIMKKLDYVKLTILCDNAVGIIGGIGEHGYAVFIEAEDGPYLFDTGSGVGILSNAKLLEMDLGSIKKIFLSHGHYDHTGGLSTVLDSVNSVSVYAHPAVFGEKYSVSRKGDKTETRFIGIPQRRELLEAKGAIFQLDKGFREVGEGVFLTGEIPRVTGFEAGEDRLKVKSNGTFAIDAFPDDQALVISTRKGLVVLLGCCHAGAINTLRYVRSKLKDEPVYAVIGGTHWGFMEEKDFAGSIEILKTMNISMIGVSHCTGIPVAHKLINEFGAGAFYASVGTVTEIG
jgi:7,8-dihydropterin-6-yl-methyl-4-(beta-D-ribofuranosyl)aminobenzene 5'-phosphate synthase